MTIIESVAYLQGSSDVLSKLGMSSEYAGLAKRLEEAVADEAHGKAEYGDTADMAEDLGLTDIERLARSHQKDEMRHGKENRAALSSLKKRG